jgi:hypothetical protein
MTKDGNYRIDLNHYGGLSLRDPLRCHTVFLISSNFGRTIEILFDFKDNKKLQYDLEKLVKSLDVHYVPSCNLGKLCIDFDNTEEREKAVSELISSLN